MAKYVRALPLANSKTFVMKLHLLKSDKRLPIHGTLKKLSRGNFDDVTDRDVVISKLGSRPFFTPLPLT